MVLWNHGGSADSIHQQGFPWTVNILSPASSYLAGIPDLVLQTNPAASRLAVLHSSTGSFSSSVAEGAMKRRHPNWESKSSSTRHSTRQRPTSPVCSCASKHPTPTCW